MIQFDESSHRYTLDGQVIPSVTTILKPLYDFSMVDKTVLERKAELGTNVHLACEFYDQDDLDMDSLPDEMAGYVKGWIKFISDTGFKPIRIEHRVFHPTHRYAGTLDRTGLYNGDLALVDIKTTSVMSDAVGIQLEAYKQAIQAEFPDEQIKRRIAVQLKEDGTYRMHEYKEPSDFAIFLSLLNVHRWKEAHK